MFRYLYQDKNPIAGFVKRQYMHYKWEEQGYIAALLARSRVKRLQDIPDPLDAAYNEVNLMEIEEHYELAKSDHVEQSFKLLSALNKATLGESDIILNKRYEELSKITDIIDPDKFPIFSLIETLDQHELVSIWDFKKNDIMKPIRKQLGFSLEIAQSTLEHHLAGEGTFLKTYESNQKIFTGQMLGFLGGVQYEQLQDFQNSRNGDFPADSYVHRYDDTVIDFAQNIPYPFIYGTSLKEYYDIMATRKESDKLHIKEVPANFINPYSIGHKINHPPKFSPPNVIFLDVYIPHHFFQESLLRFFPYIRADIPKQQGVISRKNKMSNNEGNFHGIGIFALRDIEDGEELFVDYMDCNFYDVNDTPDWLIRPPPLAPQYKKDQLEFEFSTLAKFIDRFILSKKLSVYEQFARQVSHDPSKEDLKDKTDLLKDKFPKQFKAFLKTYDDDGVEEGYFANKIKQKQLTAQAQAVLENKKTDTSSKQ